MQTLLLEAPLPMFPRTASGTVGGFTIPWCGDKLNSGSRSLVSVNG